MIETKDFRDVLADLGAQISDDDAETVTEVWQSELLPRALAAFQPLQGQRPKLEVLAAMLLSFLKDIENIDLDRCNELAERFGMVWSLDRTGFETGFRGPTPKA
jgi:hypothetical protein